MVSTIKKYWHFIALALAYYFLTKKKMIKHGTAEQLTTNFNLKEFHSNDGADMPIEVYNNIKRLAVELQKVRDMLGVPMKINSGYRSPELNASDKVKGATKSYHMKGMAADVTAQGLKASEVYLTIAQMIDQGSILQGGMGSYPNFTHYDIRGKKARWKR